jgi:DNA-binding CsgD family transcriptional regulator/tetratricopeptide (TPR) repeat protein
LPSGARSNTLFSVRASPHARQVLLEREADLALLSEAVDRAAQGSGGIVLVEGPGGIGKSSLLSSTVRTAAGAGLRVHAARGSELEREYPFGVVRQLLESRGGPAAPKSSHVAGAFPRGEEGELSVSVAADLDEAVAQVGPFGAVAQLDQVAAEVGDGGAVSFAVLHRMYWWFATAAGNSPLVLSIDDLHWCDRPSLRFLAFLAQRIEDLPIAVIGSLRAADIGTDPRLIGALVRDPTTVSIRPQPLSSAAVGRLVGEVLDAPADVAFAAACRHATGGNPLLLSELLGAVRREHVRPTAGNVGAIGDIGPQAVVRSVLLRLLRLPDGAVDVARAVAVLGDGAPCNAIAAVAGVEEARVARATRDLVGAEILSGGAPGFVHPVVRDAVYHDLTSAERELRHAAAAEWLWHAGAPPEQVAAHLLELAPRGTAWALDALRRAARLAMSSGAPDSAVTYLRRALHESPTGSERGEVLHELGSAEMLIDGTASAEHLAAAYAAATEPLAQASIAAQLARMLIFIRPPEEAAALATRAAGALPAELVDERRSLLALELYAPHFGSTDRQVAGGLPDAPGELAGGGPGSRMLLAVAAWNRALTGDPAERCLALARAALADGVLAAVDPGFMAIVAVGVLALADADDAVAGWEASLRGAQRNGSLFAVTGVHLWQGWTWLQRGELEEAGDSLRLAIEETERYNAEWDVGMAYACGFLARVLLERGDVAGAEAVLARTGRPAPGSDADAVCVRARLEVLLAQRRDREAVEAAEEAGRRLGHVLNPGWLPWRSLHAAALHRSGRRDGAIELLGTELDLARCWGAPGTVGPALRRLGTMLADGSADRERGPAGEGLELLQEAVAVTTGCPARLEHAKSLAALGSALRRTRRPADARRPLRQALELATASGARPLADHVRTELLAAGGRPRTSTVSGVGALTASERRVAELAVTGLSNRDIARTLYVTTKTVEVHLSSSYRKLGIGSRGGLAAAISAGA